MSEIKKVAVILCGSGYLDGNEINEAIFTLLSLSQENVVYECFAPNEKQMHVVNHLTGKEMTHDRNMLEEAARITRSKIKDLKDLNSKNFAGVIIPGGFGAAKNLSTFALKGSKAEVRSDVASLLNQFHNEKKVIGAMCIAPAVVALSFKNKNLTMTLGENSEASAEMEKLGHKHIAKEVTEIVVDKEHRIVTTPAFMYGEAKLSDVFTGISSLVKEVKMML